MLSLKTCLHYRVPSNKVCRTMPDNDVSRLYSAEQAETSKLGQKLDYPAGSKPDLHDIIKDYQQAWWGRLNNIGGGIRSPNQSGLGNAANTLLSVASGGVLGSYGLSREATLNRKIDEIVKIKVKTDLDSTYKVTSLFASSADQLERISSKIEVCENIGSLLDSLIKENKESLEFFDKMRKALNPGVLGAVREKVSNGWEAVKDGIRKKKEVVGAGAAGLLGIDYATSQLGGATITGKALGVAAVKGQAVLSAAPGALYGAATYLTSGLGALAGAAIATPSVALPVIGGVLLSAAWGARKYAQNRKALEANLEMLDKMRQSLDAIKQKSTEEQDKLIGKVTKQYKPEYEVQKNMRDIIRVRLPDQAGAFEEAVEKGQVVNFIKTLRGTTNFHPAEFALLERYAKTLDSRRAKNLRQTLGKMLGKNTAKGPQEIGRLIGRLVKLNDLVGVRGKSITFNNTGLTLRILELNGSGSSTSLVLGSPSDPRDKAIMRITESAGDYKISLLAPKYTFRERKVQLDLLLQQSSRGYEYPYCKFPEGANHENIRKEVNSLLQKSLESPLSEEEYKKLSQYLAWAPAYLVHEGKETEQLFPSHSTLGVVELNKENKLITKSDDLIQEIIYDKGELGDLEITIGSGVAAASRTQAPKDTGAPHENEDQEEEETSTDTAEEDKPEEPKEEEGGKEAGKWRTWMKDIESKTDELREVLEKIDIENNGIIKNELSALMQLLLSRNSDDIKQALKKSIGIKTLLEKILAKLKTKGGMGKIIEQLKALLKRAPKEAKSAPKEKEPGAWKRTMDRLEIKTDQLREKLEAVNSENNGIIKNELSALGQILFARNRADIRAAIDKSTDVRKLLEKILVKIKGKPQTREIRLLLVNLLKHPPVERPTPDDGDAKEVI